MKTKIHLLKAITPIFLFFLLISCGDSSKKVVVDDRASLYSKMYDMADLSITIETDLAQIVANKEKTENIYQPAKLIASDGASTSIEVEIEVRPRGVTRKTLCDFPPIMIKIKKDHRAALDLKKTDNIKLVSFCKDDPVYQQLVMKEYLSYKLYNVLTDTSYHAKLAKVNIKNSIAGGEDIIEKLAFMIEPTDDMASRLACTYDENDTSPVKKIHKEQYKNFVVFQYMIGNTDWNLSGRHNIRMLDCNSEMGPKPVPYDFDYSGLVSAPYAKPHPMLPIKRVTDRLFQFRGSIDEDFTATYALFNERKDQFYAVVNDFPHLEDDVKNQMTSYLDAFYVNISDLGVMRGEMEKVRKKK